MKNLIIALAIAAIFVPAISFAHGGGCRKDSPRGQCCHKERATGRVHCH